MKSIPEKVSAALNDVRIQRFLYPSLEGDLSLARLAPGERDRIQEALLQAKGRLSLFLGSAIRGAIGPRLDMIFGDSFHNNSVPQFTIDIELLKKRDIKKKRCDYLELSSFRGSQISTRRNN